MTAVLKHRTLSAAIVDQLRQAILKGAHPAGSQLRQDTLAETYGVSRIPVREALFQLESEGLVRIVPHKGAIVAELSLNEVNDVFDLRAMLEPRLLAQSAPHFEEADFHELEAVHARFVAAIADNDVTQWGQLNADFHMMLYARAPLPRTHAIVNSLLQISDRYTRMQLSTTEYMGRAEREHGELIALCRSKKASEAGALLARHIETGRTDLLRVLKRTKPAL
jgi:DNA-binding GntR family transcriptional regulator